MMGHSGEFGAIKPFTRSSQRVRNNLGIIPGVSGAHGGAKLIRSPQLEFYDSYYEGRAYEHLMDWKQPAGLETHISIRKRKPLIQYNFAKIAASRVAAKLVGMNMFPVFTVEDDPDTSELIRLVIQQSRLKSKLMEPTKRMLNSGSVLVRFAIIEGQYKIEHFLGKYCYPEFDAIGGLNSVRIQYVFPDPNELDEKGMPVLRWFKMELDKEKEVLFDNPKYVPQEPEPIFKVVEEIVHGFDFVQAEWFRSSEEATDGFPLIGDGFGFVDAINYSLSQTDQAISYNQDPQLLIKGMDEDELDLLIRSAMKAWNLGKEGEASLLEASLSGTESAKTNREELDQRLINLTRIIMLDPEKIAGSAQSGKAMELLFGPFVELINELRPQFAFHTRSLIEKMTVATLISNKRGELTALEIPPGFTPKSFNITEAWPEIFPMTMDDLSKKVGVVVSATSANLLSRETGLKFIAKDFGIEDIEEEVARVDAQPIFNPFGSF